MRPRAQRRPRSPPPHQVRLHEAQEAALKDALREAERASARLQKAGSGVDMEYLKNAVIKLFLTGEAEALLPVFASILSLSPEEVKRCREGVEAIQHADVPMAAAAAAVDTATSLLGGWSGGWGWLGGGGGGGGGSGNGSGNGSGSGGGATAGGK
ncbi:MAG: hypothetical protein J3K34DRAFT_292693 [Monoraphidium minutum]|nr:MAG: hypothetical protein J3K34DRAFT_292693 [Monoraphidium minutum]